MKDMNHGDAATRSETLLSDVRNSAIPISWVHTSRRGKEGGREPQRPPPCILSGAVNGVNGARNRKRKQNEVGFALQGQGDAYVAHPIIPGLAQALIAYGLSHCSHTSTLTFIPPARVSIGAYTFSGVSLTSQYDPYSR